MADKKISQLSAASTPLAGTEVLPIVQSSATVKVATNDLTVKNVRSNATTGILQIVGPAAAATRTMTVPDANFTVARTDAANSLTGDQTITSGSVVLGTSGEGIEYSTTAGFYESSGGWSFKLDGAANTIKFTAAGNIECIRRTNSNAAFQVVTTNSNNAGWNAAGAVQLVSNDLSTGRSINCTGTVNQSGFDYAEYMTKSGDFEIAKGDVCGVDSNGKLTKTFSEAITFVVKSTDPGLVGGDQWGVGLADDPVALEEERKKVDRIAFCGQVPVNVLNAQPGQYIVPVDDNGVIKGQAVSDPTFEQYRVAVGKVIAIEADGRAKIIVKIS